MRAGRAVASAQRDVERGTRPLCNGVVHRGDIFVSAHVNSQASEGGNPYSRLCTHHAWTAIDVSQEGIGELPGKHGQTIVDLERASSVSLGRLLDRHQAGHPRGA